MIHKMFKVGNRLVVSLPKDALNVLGMTEEGDVSVKLDKQQRQIVITPLQPLSQPVDNSFATHVKEFIDAYRPALEALAQ